MDALPIDVASWFLANFCGLRLRGKLACATKHLRDLTRSAVRQVEIDLGRHFRRIAEIDEQIPAGDTIRSLVRTPELLCSTTEPIAFADLFREVITWSVCKGTGLAYASRTAAVCSIYAVNYGFLLVVRVDRDSDGACFLSFTRSQNGITDETRLALPDIAPGHSVMQVRVSTADSHAVFVAVETRDDFDYREYFFRYDFLDIPSPRITPIGRTVAERWNGAYAIELPEQAPSQWRNSGWRYTTGFSAYRVDDTVSYLTKSATLENTHEDIHIEVVWYSGASEKRAGYWMTSTLFYQGICSESETQVLNSNGISILAILYQITVSRSDGPLWDQIYVPIDPSDGSPLFNLAWRRPTSQKLLRFAYAWWTDDAVAPGERGLSDRRWYIVIENPEREQWEVYRNDDLLMYSIPLDGAAATV